jgi:hypothetical protein
VKVQPVKQYRRVGYPTSTQSSLRLSKEVPHRWKRNGMVLTALAGSSVMALCVSAEQQMVTRGKVAVRYDLTEADARQIATTEAKKRGVIFVEKRRPVDLTISLDGGKSTKTISYLLDEIDSKKGVGFDYVTKKDCETVYGKDTNVKPAALAKIIKSSLSKAKLSGKVKIVSEPDVASWDSKAKLRKEIVSFLKWLKSQGVI